MPTEASLVRVTYRRFLRAALCLKQNHYRAGHFAVSAVRQGFRQRTRTSKGEAAGMSALDEISAYFDGEFQLFTVEILFTVGIRVFICSRGSHPAAATEEEWEHMFKSLAMLERAAEDPVRRRLCHELRRDLSLSLGLEADGHTCMLCYAHILSLCPCRTGGDCRVRGPREPQWYIRAAIPKQA